jgi:hypothetical protein
MSTSGRRFTDQQASFTRQALILRKNLSEWDRMLRTPRGEDWPAMLGRLNAALNQTLSMDRSIDDVLEHFVYLPRKSTANAQDIPFFLSTRLEIPSSPSDVSLAHHQQEAFHPDPFADLVARGEAVQQLNRFEGDAAKLAAEYEENMMVRF